MSQTQTLPAKHLLSVVDLDLAPQCGRAKPKTHFLVVAVVVIYVVTITT